MTEPAPIISGKKRTILHVCLDLAAYLVIPCITVQFVRGSNWFTTNFSVLGNGPQRQNDFAFWGLLVGVYFFTILEIIAGYLARPRRETFFIPLSLILLTCAITTPYLPDILPLKSFLHVVFAFLSAVCLAAFLGILVWKLFRTEPVQFGLYQAGLILIFMGSGLLLAVAGIISSALEIFFTISMSVFCRRLERKLRRLREAGKEILPAR